MKTEQTDIKLYLQRQSACGMLKITRILDGIFTPPFITFLLMGVLFSVIQLIIMPVVVESLLFMPLCIVVVGCVGVLLFAHLYYSCSFPRLKPLLSVDEIEALCSSTFCAYQKMGHFASKPKSGIDYIDTLICEGIPMNYHHRARVKALVEADVRDHELNTLSQEFETVIAQSKTPA